MTSTHILKIEGITTISMSFNEDSGQFVCLWDPPPPFPKADTDRVIKEYEPWRNAILDGWSERTGKRVLCVSC